MDLAELKEKADRWQKLQAMIRSLEVNITEGKELSEGQKKQLQEYVTQCRSEAEGLSGCWEEYEAAWNTKRSEVEKAGGDAWNEILRCQEEILKAEERLRTLEKGDSVTMDPREREYLKEMEVEHMQSIAEVIQWLVIEA